MPIAYMFMSIATIDGRNEVLTVQSLSDIVACRLFAELQKCFRIEPHIYIPIPTWANHHNIQGVPMYCTGISIITIQRLSV
jgi:aspartate/tyrosine/aromatic aminotransferase